MTDLPELSKSTQRKLELQWESLLDRHSLTGEHFRYPADEEDRLRRVRSQTGYGGDEHGSRSSGHIESPAFHLPSITAAEEHFNQLSGEYLRVWLDSGDEYETFVSWLAIVERIVLTEIASVWTGRSEAIDRWYETTCEPAIRKALTTRVDERTQWARTVEITRHELSTAPERQAEIRRTAAIPVTNVPSPGTVVNGGANGSTESGGSGMRQQVDGFIQNVFRAKGRRITKSNIWRSAGYKDDTQFLRFQRGTNASPRSIQKFTEILNLSPAEFVERLDNSAGCHE